MKPIPPRGKPAEQSNRQTWSASDVRNFVGENDDFGFEMRVAAAAREVLGVPISHGATYVDPISGKPRQYDFRFRIFENRATLYFSVESKNIDLCHPVVVCGRRAEAKESFHDVIVSHCHAAFARSHTHRIKNSAVYSCDRFVGKTLLQPDKHGRSNDREIYDRWSQAVASAHVLVEEAVKKPTYTNALEYGVVFPWLVVPDGALWCAEYNDEGRLVTDPVPVDRSALFLGYEISWGIESRHNPVILSHLEIATLTGFRNFVGKLVQPQLDWEVWVPSTVRETYQGH